MNEDKKADGSRLDWIDQVNVERLEIQEGLLLFLPAIGRIM
jgi:hypothetical protein